MKKTVTKRTGIIMLLDALLHVMKHYKYSVITLEEIKELRQAIIDDARA